jgi:hypothetical protein
MAPYNTQYERLAVHLAAAGVSAEPNLWDSPVTLAREHRRATPDSEATSVPGARPPSGHPRRCVAVWPVSWLRRAAMQAEESYILGEH